VQGGPEWEARGGKVRGGDEVEQRMGRFGGGNGGIDACR